MCWHIAVHESYWYRGKSRFSWNQLEFCYWIPHCQNFTPSESLAIFRVWLFLPLIYIPFFCFPILSHLFSPLPTLPPSLPLFGPCPISAASARQLNFKIAFPFEVLIPALLFLQQVTSLTVLVCFYSLFCLFVGAYVDIIWF